MCLDKRLKKSVCSILVLCSPWVSVALGEGAEVINKGQELIALVEKQQDGAIERGIESYRILGILMYTSSFPELVAFSTNKWELILKNWDQLATNKTQRLIEMHAMSYLPPEQYIKWLHHLRILYREKQLNDIEFLALLVMIENDKKWFLPYNYKAPEVVDFLNKLDNDFQGIGYMQKMIKDIRNGKVKAREEFLRNRKTKLFRENNPVPMLPSMIQYENSLAGQIEKRKNLLVIGLLTLSIVGYCVYRRRRKRHL